MLEKQVLDRWREIIQSEGLDAANRYYERHIFPDVIKIFSQKNDSYRQKFKYLVSLLGMSPEPVILTLHALQPKKVMFLYSKESEPYLQKIDQFYHLHMDQVLNREIDPSRVESIYEQIKWFVQQKDVAEIAVDITGGKKAMVSGASAAASFLGCTIFYVDYSEYNPTLRKPVPGTEYLNKLKNPAEVFGDITRREGVKLFHSGDYHQAKQVFLELKKKVIHTELYEIYLNLIYFYENWENYEFKKALKHGLKVGDLIEQFRLCEHLRDKIYKQQELVQKLKNGEKPWLTCNHFFMAERFAARKRFDFAALLLYRTIEMAANFRLAEKYGIKDDQPDYSNYEGLEEKYQKIAGTVYPGNKYGNKLPAKIGFMGAIILLSALGDDFVLPEQLKQLYFRTEMRNKSVLAHGTKPVSEDNYNSMNHAFVPLFEKFIALYLPGHSYTELQNIFQPVLLE